jgi:hypothetical protein
VRGAFKAFLDGVGAHGEWDVRSGERNETKGQS